MRRLRETMAVRCPIGESQSRIERFLAGRLRVRLGPDPENGSAPDREVHVEAYLSRDDRNVNDLIHVSWKADGDLPLPAFAGTLVTWTESNPKLTFIELDGTYDDALGRKTAQSTAKNLLAQIAAAIADAPPV